MRTTTGLIKSLEATALVRARRFVKLGAADGVGVEAVDGAAYIRGVSADIDTAAGERISVQMVGNVAEIIYGGPVTRGDPLTADAQGRAVTAAPAAGANVFIGGYAEISGVLNDVGSIDVLPGRIQG